jgi:hypothetical protein
MFGPLFPHILASGELLVIVVKQGEKFEDRREIFNTSQKR